MRRILPWIAMCALLCGGSAAAAPSAEEHAKQADTLRAQGKYGQAAAALWDAWMISKQPQYLVSVCTMQVKARDCTKAWEILSYAPRRVAGKPDLERALQQCKADALQAGCKEPPPPPPPPPGKPPTKTILLTVESDPAGAMLSVDGAPKGVTPRTMPLSPGAHRIELELAGHRPVQRTDVLNEDNTLRLTLVKDLAELHIDSPDGSADDADVTLNGKALGKVPMQHQLPPGPCDLVFTKKGYIRMHKHVVLQAGPVQRISINLVRSAGTLVIRGQSGTEIFLDGTSQGRLGQGDMVLPDVPDGPHSVQAIRPGGAPDFSEKVHVVPGQQHPVNVPHWSPPPPDMRPAAQPVVVVPDMRPSSVPPPVPPPMPGSSGASPSPAPGSSGASPSPSPGSSSRSSPTPPPPHDTPPPAPGRPAIRFELIKPIPGAHFFVNEREVTESDALRGVEVSPGWCKVYVRREGHRDFSQERRAAAGVLTTVRVPPLPPLGR